MSKAPKNPTGSPSHVARLRGGAAGTKGGKAGAAAPGDRGAGAGQQAGSQAAGQQQAAGSPRPLKELAAEFGRVAKELRADKIDVPTARLILRAMQSEFRCLETQLRFGDVVIRSAWEK